MDACRGRVAIQQAQHPGADPLLGWPARRPVRRRVGTPCQVHQVYPLGLIQLKGYGHSLKHRI
jgi:hypothetical protein